MKAEKNTLDRHGHAALMLGAQLLAQVSTPPAELLALDLEAPTRTEYLAMYGLADGGYTVISATYADGALADTTVQNFDGSDQVQHVLGVGLLPSALYHVAALPVSCTRDSDGNPSISDATIRCLAWSEMTLDQPKTCLVGYGDLTEEGYLCWMKIWFAVVGSKHLPTTFADTESLRRHIAQQADQVSSHEKRVCLDFWRAMTEWVAIRAAQALQAGVRQGEPVPV